MKQFDLKKEKMTSTEREPLPAGGYVAKILNAEEKSNDIGKQIVVSFDIIEGDYRGYFKDLYVGSQYEDKKWKGNYYLPVPDENYQYYESQKKKFGNFIACVEESNNGYTWDWNERTLKDKLVGVVFGNYEWEYKGKTGWSTKCMNIVSVNDIREGNFNIPKDKPLNNNPTNEALPAGADKFVTDVKDIEDELPF